MEAPTNSKGMFCSISGIVPDIPVVSAKSGHIFEKRLIEQALEASGGRCPETGEVLAPSDLIEIRKSGTVVEPTVPADVSVPGVLRHLQKEWDTTMLELHQVKTELNETRKELANALYKYETAERVIAQMNQEMAVKTAMVGGDKLQAGKTNGIKVKQGAKTEMVGSAVPPSQASETGKMKGDTGNNATSIASRAEGEAEASTENGDRISSASRDFPADLIARASARSSELQRKRKARIVPESHTQASMLGSFSETGQLTIDAGDATVCSVVRGTDGLMYAGTSNGKLCAFHTRGMDAVGKTVVGHAEGVRKLRMDGEKVVSCGGKEVKVWEAVLWKKIAGWEEEGQVVDVDVHPLGGLVLVILEGGRWTWRETGGKLVCAGGDSERGYGSGVIHPDGMVFAIGRTDGIVEMWDVKSMDCVTYLGERGGSVVGLEMSEKGYYMATCVDGLVRLWDLRKQSLVGEVGLGGIVGVALDGMGEFGCAVGDGRLGLFLGKKRTKMVGKVPLQAWVSGSGGRAGCAWGPDARCVVVGCADGTVRQFGAGVR